MRIRTPALFLIGTIHVDAVRLSRSNPTHHSGSYFASILVSMFGSGRLASAVHSLGKMEQEPACAYSCVDIFLYDTVSDGNATGSFFCDLC